MPLVKGTRSKLYTSSSNPRPPYITDVEKLHHALLRSQQEVLKMREQMEFLAFLVRRAWQGDRNAMSDVASIVGIKDADMHGDLLQFTDSEPTADSERWATMVENMLEQERARDAEQTSTVKLVEREMMLDEEIDNHTPVFSSYLNKTRGNFSQKIKTRAKSAGPARSFARNRSSSNLMTEPPSAPASSPRTCSGLSPRPLSAPALKKATRRDNVSVHGSQVMIAHNPTASEKLGRCRTCPRSDQCVCPIMSSKEEGAWRAVPRFSIPTSANCWSDDGNLKFGNQVLREKDQVLVAILCASGK